jgi:hypothetical protein
LRSSASRGLFGKWLPLSPVVIVLGRTTIAAIALGVVLLRARRRAPFDVRLIANGVVLALHWLSFFAAIQASTVAVGLLALRAFHSSRFWPSAFSSRGVCAGAMPLRRCS